MVGITSVSGEIQYNVMEFAIDTPEDLPKLPKHCSMGSTAIVISTAEVYMKNSAGEWVKL